MPAPPLTHAITALTNVTPSAPPNPNTIICPIANPSVGRPSASNGRVSWLPRYTSGSRYSSGLASPSAVVCPVALFHQ